MPATKSKPSTRRSRRADGPTPEEKIVASLIGLLEAGTTPWRKPWSATAEHHANLLSGHRYQGTNVILLEVQALARGLKHRFWLGFNEARNQGLSVRKGSTACYIMRPLPVTETVTENGIESKKVAFVRFSAIPVFNVADLEGEGLDELIAARQEQQGIGRPTEVERLETAEAVLSAWPVPVVFGGEKACYIPTFDRIHLPERSTFTDAPAFYATWAHEAIHSTGHDSRLNRDQSGVFGSASYAEEELVAELGSVLLGDRLEIGSDLQQHASYASHWIEKLREEPKFLMRSLGAARRAVDLICGSDDAQ